MAETLRSRASVPERAKPLGRIVLLWLLTLSGCSLREVAEALVPDDHMLVSRDVEYGERGRQRLDVYRPRGAQRAAPVVVFLYGGRWQSGSKEDYRLLGSALTRRGYVLVVPDYRLYPEVLFPAWVHDAALAVAWASQHAQSYGGDPERLFVVGHSAGAHTAALLALDERYLLRAGAPPGVVRGFASLAGPVDTRWTDPDVQALMGPSEHWPVTYPVSFVDGTESPLLLLHGGEDDTVEPASSARLAAAIRDRGGCVRSIVYPDVGHIEIVVALAAPWLPIAPVLPDLTSFFREPVEFACGGAPDRAGALAR